MPNQVATFALDGHLPPDCSRWLEDRLAGTPGLRAVTVQPMAGRVTVEYDPEQVTPAALEELLRCCGYGARALRAPQHLPRAGSAHGPGAPHEPRAAGPHAEHGPAPEALEAQAERAYPISDYERHEIEGAGGDHRHMEQEFSRRLWVSAALTIPVLILSPTIQSTFGFRLPPFPGDRLLLLLLATAIVFYGGWPFYVGARRALRSRSADMNVLVSLAVLSGYLFSAASVLLMLGVDFFWEISTLVLVLLFGHYMEMRAVGAAGGALRELARLIPPTANVLRDGEVVEAPTAGLRVGDRVLVRPGERVPIDGRVFDGRSSLNEAMITGESRPVPKGPGDEVIGGTINGEGALRVEVTKTGSETALAQIVALVESAQASKPRTQRLADRAAQYLTLTAVFLGLGTFIFWSLLAGRPIVFALTLAITVVVIACPHALGLAIPTVTTISTSLGARNGMLIRNAEATEDARRLDTVVFDKTGT
ncbi:MAG: heavy metal translocating P-type ATPase, partial [Anaerolineae bacterium]|nr:heavy metal translocating P-type ATPase [Anaerolineae bacterium]